MALLNPRRAALLAAAALSVSCSARASGASGVTRSTLPAGLNGLSGLTIDADGLLWAVSERGVALVPLRLDGDTVALDRAPIPVAGWPVGVDAESLAWLGPGRFAVGTETQGDGRAAERVLEVVVTTAGGKPRAAVGPTVWSLPYLPFGVTGGANHGVESLDLLDGALIAASEVTVGETRAAPVWRVPLDGGPVRTAVVPLTSDNGKLSTLDALAFTDAGVELLAIERHYETVRLVAARLPSAADGAPAGTTRVVRDLAAELTDLPNIEGLARLPDGRTVLLGDNQHGLRLDGPTVVLVLAAAAE